MNAGLVSPDHVLLDLAATTREEAVRAVAGLLRADGQIANWDQFWASVGPRQIVDLKGGGCGVCLAHGRDSSVSALRLAAGRLAVPLEVPGGPALRMVFVFAIPATMSEEYLRNVGALARICREPEKTAALLAAATPAEFAGLLDAWLG